MKYCCRYAECDFATNLYYHLDGHVRSAHLKEKRHVCNRCDYATAWKGSFNRHMKEQHGETPFIDGRKTRAKTGAVNRVVNPGAAVSSPSKRVKEEPPSAENIIEEQVEKLLDIEEGIEKCHGIEKRAADYFNTSSERDLTAKDQAVSMIYAEFRELFGIPLGTPKQTIFNKTHDQWIVAVGDDMIHCSGKVH